MGWTESLPLSAEFSKYHRPLPQRGRYLELEQLVDMINIANEHSGLVTRFSVEYFENKDGQILCIDADSGEQKATIAMIAITNDKELNITFWNSRGNDEYSRSDADWAYLFSVLQPALRNAIPPKDKKVVADIQRQDPGNPLHYSRT